MAQKLYITRIPDSGRIGSICSSMQEGWEEISSDSPEYMEEMVRRQEEDILEAKNNFNYIEATERKIGAYFSTPKLILMKDWKDNQILSLSATNLMEVYSWIDNVTTLGITMQKAPDSLTEEQKIYLEQSVPPFTFDQIVDQVMTIKMQLAQG